MSEKHINKNSIPCQRDSTKNPPPCEVESQINPPLRKAESKLISLVREAESKSPLHCREESKISPLPCGGGLGVGIIPQGYKQTSIGTIPQDWEQFELGDIISIDSTKFNTENSKSQPCIELEHLSQDTGQILGFTESKNQKSIKNSFKKGQILFGKLRPYLRKFWRAEFDGVCSSEIWVMSGKKISNDFLFYLIQTEKFTQIANVSTGTKMPRADWDYMQEIPFSIPPLKEQEKIARILGVWDSAIDSLANLIKAKRKYKTALMQRLLTPPRYTTSCHTDAFSCHTSPSCHTEGVARSIQKDDLQGNDICLDSSVASLPQNDKEKNAENGREISSQNDKENTHNDKKKIRESSLRFAGFSDKWQEFRLGDICKIKKGEQLNKLSLSDNMEGKFAVINGGILPSGYTDKFNTHENTITISEGGNSCGFVNLILEKFWSGGHCYTIADSKADTLFLFHSLKFREKFIQDLRVGSGLPNIQKKDIEKFKIFIPTLAEQKKIAQVLSVCDKEIETLNLKFECLKAQKRGLMQQLLSGKVRVKC